ncbi:MAG: hypothetical protein QXN35_01000 [Ignisphaera sp.]
MKQIKDLFNKLYSCIDNTATISINLDTINRVLAFHRLAILSSTVEKIPQQYRQILYTTSLNIQQEREYTQLDRECIEIIKDIAEIATVASTRVPIQRVSIFLSRTAALLIRRLSDTGIYISRQTLKGLLHELEVYLSTALDVIT